MPHTRILFHSNCPDGFAAQYVLKRHLEGASVDSVAMRYGDDLPDINEMAVICVDFCPPAEQLVEIEARAETLLVLDHHQTALGYIEDAGIKRFDTITSYMEGNEYHPNLAILDLSSSGVGLAMEWVGSLYAPFMFIEDRDLWRFDYQDTPAVFAAITSRPYTDEAYAEILRMEVGELVAEGQAIERYRQQLIEACVETAFPWTFEDGTDVLMAACPYAIGSDVAGELATRCESGVGAYFVPYGNRVRYGLRSRDDGPDVAAIAEHFGGGGHRHASGFEL